MAFVVKELVTTSRRGIGCDIGCLVISKSFVGSLIALQLTVDYVLGQLMC